MDIDCWYRFLPSSPARILDIGCGDGSFVRRAASLGHDAVGVDFDRTAVDNARAAGIRIQHISEITAATFENSFDHITFNHVIEHLPEPSRALEQARKWLKPGGWIYIEAPNSEAHGLKQFGRFWRGLEAPRHFALPSRIALQKALKRAGFQDTEWFERETVYQSMAIESSDAQKAFGDEDRTLADDTSLNGSEFLTVVARADG